MKDFHEGKLHGLIETLKKWSPAGCPHLFFPEDVRREFDVTLAVGKWWDWLPCWAYPLKDFANDVSIVAGACLISKEELVRRILQLTPPMHCCPVYLCSEPFSYKVPVWELVQAVEAWIFFDLRPTLREIIALELDCRVC